MNKILVKLYVPILEEEYNVWLPINKKIGNVIILLVKAINEINGGYYNPVKMPILYDKATAKAYDVHQIILESSMRNGAELVLI